MSNQSKATLIKVGVASLLLALGSLSLTHGCSSKTGQAPVAPKPPTLGESITVANTLSEAACFSLTPEDQNAARGILAPMFVSIDRGDLDTVKVLFEDPTGIFARYRAWYNLTWSTIHLVINRITPDPAEWIEIEQRVISAAACGCGQGLGLAVPSNCSHLAELSKEVTPASPTKVVFNWQDGYYTWTEGPPPFVYVRLKSDHEGTEFVWSIEGRNARALYEYDGPIDRGSIG